MDLESLLERLDPLAFPARQGLLADTARSLAGSSSLTALLAELGAQPGITRTWAVMMATVAGDQVYLRRCLTSPELAVTRVAVNYCVKRGLHFEVVLDALPTAPIAWRHVLYRALRTTGAAGWAGKLLPAVRDRFGDHEAAVVLPACDADTVMALLPELDFAIPNLAALARRHPDVVLGHVRQRLTEAGEVGRAGGVDEVQFGDRWTRPARSRASHGTVGEVGSADRVAARIAALVGRPGQGRSGTCGRDPGRSRSAHPVLAHQGPVPGAAAGIGRIPCRIGTLHAR
jgi:hypothetical protein